MPLAYSCVFSRNPSTGRILGEVQNALAVLIDPGTMPVQIDTLQMTSNSQNEVTIAIEGSATYLGSLSSSEVLNQLKDALQLAIQQLAELLKSLLASANKTANHSRGF